MRKALTITLVAALALIVSGAAYANYCARDVVPAATLLVPFARQTWDFGTSKPVVNGYHTILSVTNVSSDAQIIHITVWNALSVPVLDFDQVLSGYDQWIFDMRDMLNNEPFRYATSFDEDWYANIDVARPPFAGPDHPTEILRETFEWGPDGRTAFLAHPSYLDDPQSTNDLVSTNCFVDLTEIPGTNFDDMITGLESPMLMDYDHAGCAGAAVRSAFADTWTQHVTDLDEIWFYVTVDVVEKCGLEYAGSDNGYYFTDFYKRTNVLIGDIIYLDGFRNYSEAIPAVHVEADDTGNAGLSQYFQDEKARDGDAPSYGEPLATAFAFRYAQIHAGDTDISSNVIVWKNHHQIDDNLEVDDCGDYLYFSWDADEHSLSRYQSSCPVSPCVPVSGLDPNIWPFETQIVPVTTKNFDLPDMYGWILAVFSPSYPGHTPEPSSDSGRETKDATQAWFGVQFTYGGYSAAMEAATLANANCFNDQVLPMLGIDYDYVTE